MNKISILDVTLRDGGCVNDFNFGQEYMTKILSSLEKAGLEYIELGYIDSEKGSAEGRTQYVNDAVIQNCILKEKKEGIKYVAMMDYGRFDPEQLQQRTKDSIDGIRVAFHKKNAKDVVAIGKTIMAKGYEFFVQPMITLRYTDSELIELIEMVNRELPDASGFYIVDSFGEMRSNDMTRLLNLVDHNLIPGMTLGFHSHNNLQMSYSNAVEMLKFPINRTLMLDCSIMGMGKGAGNLNTELLLEHLNLFYGKHYNTAPLLEVIDKVINQLRAENYWGYAVEYYLSSINGCTPSYASHFYNKHMLPVDYVAELLGMIDETKKISFDKEYAETLYRQYNERKPIDDTEAVKELKAQLQGKKVLLIAPGKNVKNAKEQIESLIGDQDTVTISLNNFEFETDYYLTTRVDYYNEAVNDSRNVIVTSNISKGGRGSVKILDYKKWIVIDESTFDSSGVIALNLLKACETKEVLLAGFDGFSTNINSNYCNPALRHPVTEVDAELRNKFFKKFVGEIRKVLNVTFITDTRYE
jgi:4-hydroxy 2-oxovalerate aldolase